MKIKDRHGRSMSKSMEGLDKQIKNTYFNKVLPRMKQQAISMAEMIVSQIDINGRGLAGVTGNAANGIAVGVYLNRLLVGYACTEDLLQHRPTRLALAAGEKYGKNRIYWDGRDVNRQFEGFFGSKNDTPKRAIEALRKHVPRRAVGYAYFVVAAADYAQWIESDESGGVDWNKPKGNLITKFYLWCKANGAKEVQAKLYGI